MKKIAMIALATAAAVMSLPAAAQFAKPEDAIKYRQGSFTVIAHHFGQLGAMANGRVAFDAQAAQRHGDVLAMASTLPWGAFGEGTDKGATKSRSEIWSEKAKFKEHSDKFQAEATKLAAAAKTGDVNQLKAAFGPAAQTCKACHDAFRSR